MPAHIRELDASETHLAYLALRELRPERIQLRSPEAFTAWINSQQRPEGYRLVASFADAPSAEPGAVAVAGVRLLHTLAWGKVLYVDDLVTLPSYRGQGHAHELMQWLVQEAERLGCEQLHLDSGSQRHAAHRFYLNHGFDIIAYHFKRLINEDVAGDNVSEQTQQRV